MIERSHLAVIREVDRNGTLTAAAEVLCLTQSALSHAMKKLEDNLGTQIWLREGQKKTRHQDQKQSNRAKKLRRNKTKMKTKNNRKPHQKQKTPKKRK